MVLATGKEFFCKYERGNGLAGDPGFEPGLTDPESVVLPLDESPTGSDYSKGLAGNTS